MLSLVRTAEQFAFVEIMSILVKITLVITLISCNEVTISRDNVFIPYVITGHPNPLKIMYSGDWAVSNHLWSPLLDFKSDGSYEPVLAEKWTRSTDGLTWDFKLRKDLKWSDGSPITTQQVIESLNRSRNGTSHTDFSRLIKKISITKNNLIRFELKKFIPQFLLGLTYSDWSITSSNSFNEDDKNFEIINYRKLSGPYRLKTSPKTNEVVDKIELTFNNFHPKQVHSNLKSGIIQHYSTCEELVEKSDKIAAFRMYKDELSEACKNRLISKGFNIHEGQPSWIIKADFTKKGLMDLSLDLRQNIIHQVHNRIYLDYKAIGNIKATGLRAPYLYGSLPENRFNKLIQSLPLKDIKPNTLQVKIVSVDLWASWKSYKWLITNLKDLNINVVEDIVTVKSFFQLYQTGEIHSKYDVIFFPLGVGDHDPDGTWRISSKYNYPNCFSDQELLTAYLESNVEKRSSYYQGFAEKLIKKGLYIPLVMNSDVVGVHKDYSLNEGVSLRTGTSLFDLE